MSGACVWRNSVYDVATKQYMGCFVDSEDDEGAAIEIARGEGDTAVGTQTFTIPYPPGIVGFGPGCGYKRCETKHVLGQDIVTST